MTIDTLFAISDEEIISKNRALEELLFVEQADPGDYKDEIISLLDVLVSRSLEGTLTGEQVRVFRAWKLFLMSQLGHVFFDDINNG